MLITQCHYYILVFNLVFVCRPGSAAIDWTINWTEMMTEVGLWLIFNIREHLWIETIFSCWRTSQNFFQIRNIWETALE